MLNEQNRNNYSLFLIPECLWNSEYSGEWDLTCWSWHTWLREDRFLPPYKVYIRYGFFRDDRGNYRAYARNIWSRSPNIEIWCQGVQLHGDELKLALDEIRNRMLRCFGWKTLRNKFVYRYRFNYISAFPKATLADMDCHHKGADNANMKAVAEEHGVHLNREWLNATDDRIDALGLMERDEHMRYHHALGDHDAHSFKSSVSDISVSYALSTETGGMDKISNDNVNEVNYANYWSSGIVTMDVLSTLLYHCAPNPSPDYG